MALKKQNGEARNLTEEQEQKDEASMSRKQASHQWDLRRWCLTKRSDLSPFKRRTQDGTEGFYPIERVCDWNIQSA